MNVTRLCLRLVSLLAVNILLQQPLYAQQTTRAELISFSGPVQVLLKDADGYSSPEEGLLLEPGDKLLTSSSASAEISFNDDNTNMIRLGENTAAILLLEEEIKIELTEGEAFAAIQNLPAGSSFEIRTPTAVSGARGTDWVTTVTDTGTDIEAVDSVPYVRHFENSGQVSSQLTYLQAGQATTVMKFKPPAPPRTMHTARRAQWQTVKQTVKIKAQEGLVKRINRPAFDRKQFIEKTRQGRREDIKPLRGDVGSEHNSAVFRSGDKPEKMPKNKQLLQSEALPRKPQQPRPEIQQQPNNQKRAEEQKNPVAQDKPPAGGTNKPLRKR